MFACTVYSASIHGIVGLHWSQMDVPDVYAVICPWTGAKVVPKATPLYLRHGNCMYNWVYTVWINQTWLHLVQPALSLKCWLFIDLSLGERGGGLYLSHSLEWIYIPLFKLKYLNISLRFGTAFTVRCIYMQVCVGEIMPYPRGLLFI